MIRAFRCTFCLARITVADGAQVDACDRRGLVGEPLPHEPESPAQAMTRANSDGAARRATFGRGKRK